MVAKEPIKNLVGSHLKIPARLTDVFSGYLMSPLYASKFCDTNSDKLVK